MMDLRIVLSFVLLALVASVCSQTPTSTSTPITNKVDVTVYYESGCPDSIAFVKNQLEQTWKKFQKYLTVTLVPFGKSNFTRDESTHQLQFNCHHGPVECEGNKVHACAIDILKTDDDRVKMVGCLVSKTQPAPKMTTPPDYKQCAADLKLEDLKLEALKDCVSNTTRSDELLYQMGMKTQLFQNPLMNVPAVTLQNSKTSNKDAIVDLGRAVCTELGGPSKVAECKDNNGGMVQGPVLGLMALSMVLALFMGKQM